MLADESLSGPELERVQDRLNLWLRHHINTHLESVMALQEPAELDGTARGIAYQLSEHLGMLPRSQIAEEVKGLDQDVRAKMRKLGIKFGAYHVYVPASLKPAPRELAIILFALKNGGIRQPGVTDLPHIVLSGRTSFVMDPEVSPRLYEIAGFKVAGKRAVRIDILERLADIIRPLIALDPAKHYGEQPLPAGAAEGNGFRVTVEMTSLLGTAGEDFASVLTSLGYRVRRTPKLTKAADAPVADAVPTAEASADAEPTPEAVAADTAELPADAAALQGPVTEAVEEAADAALNSEAQDAVEGAAPSAVEHVEAAVEAAAVDTAAADLGAPAPAGETAAAEPEFDEIWFPGGRRPDNPRHQRGPRRAQPAQAGEAADDSKPRFRGPRRPPNGDARPPRAPRPEGDGKDRAPRRDEGRREGSNGKSFDKRPPRNFEDRPPREPRRERSFDPDSPFAKLAVLRNQKPE